MIRLNAIVFGIVCLFLMGAAGRIGAQSAAQYPQVETHVKPTSGTVGDKFRLSVTATVPDPAGLSVLPLIEIDEQSTWTLVSSEVGGDLATSDGNKSRTYSYTIAPFETGQLQLPRVAVTYQPADGATSNTVLSEPLTVAIDSVIAGSAAGNNLREVKRPVAVPLPKAVVWSGIGLLVLLVGALAWWIWHRYSDRIKKMLGGPLRPDEKALKELSQLENERLIEQKKLKEFYTRLSDAVREYLASAYGVHAIDLTSNEMLRALDELAEEQPAQHSQEFKTAMARLTELLDEADLVKFARLMPDAAHCRRALQAGRDVVGLTRYRFEPKDEEKSQAAGRPPQIRMGPPPPPVSAGNVQASTRGGGDL